MKKMAWSAGLIILAGLVTGGSACTVTLESGDGGFPADDSGIGQDTSTSGIDTGLGGDAGSETTTVPDASDTGTGADQDGGDGATCASGIATDAGACDQCVDSMCCPEVDTCVMPDDAGVDDAGRSGCIQYTQCVLDWVSSRSGNLSNGETTCAGSHSSSQQSQGNAFLSCMTGPCASACPF